MNDIRVSESRHSWHQRVLTCVKVETVLEGSSVFREVEQTCASEALRFTIPKIRSRKSRNPNVVIFEVHRNFLLISGGSALGKLGARMTGEG